MFCGFIMPIIKLKEEFIMATIRKIIQKLVTRKNGKQGNKGNSYAINYGYRCKNEFVILSGFDTVSAPYITKQQRGVSGISGEHSNTSCITKDPASLRRIIR